MNTIQNAVEHYQELFRQFSKQQNGNLENTYTIVREDSLKMLGEKGFPSKKVEAWRFTDLDELLASRFTLAQKTEFDEADSKRIQPFLLEDEQAVQLVFVNGYFSSALSRISNIPEGLSIETLQSDLSAVHSENEAFQENPFNLLVAAFSREGVHVRVKKNRQVRHPVHILSVSSGSKQASFFAQKNKIVLEAQSELTVIEQHISLEDSAGFQTRHIQMQVEENSRLDYYNFQNENKQFYHFSHADVTLGQNAAFRSHTIDFGGKLVRNNLNVILSGEGADATLNGLYLGNGSQHIDNQTTIVHAIPHCESRELYQGILDNRASGVFSGMVLVKPDAQKTDAQQSNNCLLLSEQAKIDSKPQLEIYADDVKCTHGATVGQLNEEEIFYLRSRGISSENARSILTYAFAEKVIEQIKVVSLKEKVEVAFREKFQEHLSAE